MLPGKMFDLSDGTEMTFEIQKSYGTGLMTAYNPATQERFSGQYTATFSGGGTTRGTMTNSSGESSTVSIVSPPQSANARGILKGDSGTIISISLDIQPGLRPRGHGEGIDNKSVRYQVHF
jgi:hypothetical protein